MCVNLILIMQIYFKLYEAMLKIDDLESLKVRLEVNLNEQTVNLFIFI